MPDRTPGEIAYFAWENAMCRRSRADSADLWALCSADEQAAWEAAAQAARALVCDRARQRRQQKEPTRGL